MANNWSDLPPELREIIFQMLADEARRSKNMQQYRRTSYAVVCREWQNHFEKLNFRQLILSNACVSGLNEHVTGDNRLKVQRIWLRIQLRKYKCKACHGLLSPQTRQATRLANNDSYIFSQDILKFFTAMSSWDWVGRKGITFELSIHSPTDGEHFFQNRTYQAIEWTGEECLRDRDEARVFLARKEVPSDVRHCWFFGRQVIRTIDDHFSFSDAILRLSGFLPLEMTPVMNSIPRVRVISGFTMRRQYHRYLSSDALGILLTALPALQSLDHEMWNSLQNAFIWTRNSTEWEKVLRTQLPASLSRLSLFEDADVIFASGYISLGHQVADPGVAIADHSINLQRLSLAFLVDARHFLTKFGAENEQNPGELPYWPNMTELALTTDALQPIQDQNEDILMDVLLAAGRAAERMPKLETLKMWYSQRRPNSCNGAVFRYERSRQSSDGRHANSVLTVKNSWDPAIELSEPVVDQWRTVARRHFGLQLLVETGARPPALSHYGSTLQYLKLRDLILHRVSLHQIRSEFGSMRGRTYIL